jgi:hypothetical protein
MPSLRQKRKTNRMKSDVNLQDMQTIADSGCVLAISSASSAAAGAGVERMTGRSDAIRALFWHTETLLLLRPLFTGGLVDFIITITQLCRAISRSSEKEDLAVTISLVFVSAKA